jgi:hypothetical protein
MLYSFNTAFFVAPLGLEPRQAEPESDVLPLHHRAEKRVQIYIKNAMLKRTPHFL